MLEIRDDDDGAGAATGWPELPLAAWEDTRDTLHMWTQVVGKVRLGLEPALNHTWQAPLYVSARGLTTSLMPYGGRGVEMEFDFHPENRRMELPPTHSMSFHGLSQALSPGRSRSRSAA